MTAYYNENDPFAAAWLRNLIQENFIAQGEVDERSIVDVQPSDLSGFTQCHFFAGIGVWSYALRCAEWPDNRPVWTGSCPCQPFSSAGQRQGGSDSRHLWPDWARLIRECRPVAIFGEQVESAIAHGWLDLVSDDLEAQDYAVGAISFPAAGVGAPHIRQRIYWVADSSASRRPKEGQYGSGPSLLPARSSECGGTIGMEHSTIEQMGLSRRSWESRESFWSVCDWLPCIDGKSRPVEPGTFPLAHGVANRVGTLRGYGNALVAPQAQAFIEAYMEI